MNPYRHYLRWLLAITLPMVFIVATVIFVNDARRVPGLAGLLFNRDYQVLYFGDSSLYITSVCETDKTGITDYFASLSGLRTLPVFQAGYSPTIYGSYLDLLENLQHKPDTVVIPINLRGFSAESFGRPTALFPKIRQVLHVISRPADLSGYLRYLQSRYADTAPEKEALWLDQPINYPGMKLGTRKQLNERIHAAKHGAPMYLECTSQKPEDYAEAMTLMFAYYYMYELNAEHPLLQTIAKLVERVKRMGIQPLLYVMPINIEQGEHWRGPAFLPRVRANVATLRKALQPLGVVLLDLSERLPDNAEFVSQMCACEHYAAAGRLTIAKAVAEWARHINHPID